MSYQRNQPGPSGNHTRHYNPSAARGFPIDLAAQSTYALSLIDKHNNKQTKTNLTGADLEKEVNTLMEKDGQRFEEYLSGEIFREGIYIPTEEQMMDHDTKTDLSERKDFSFRATTFDRRFLMERWRFTSQRAGNPNVLVNRATANGVKLEARNISRDEHNAHNIHWVRWSVFDGEHPYAPTSIIPQLSGSDRQQGERILPV